MDDGRRSALIWSPLVGLTGTCRALRGSVLHRKEKRPGFSRVVLARLDFYATNWVHHPSPAY